MNFSSQKRISFTDYLRVLFRGRWIILITFLSVFGGTVYFTFTATPVYEAVTTMIVDEKSRQSLFALENPYAQPTAMTNQVEILRSRTLAERVIRRIANSPMKDSLELFKKNERGETRPFNRLVGTLQNSLKFAPKKDADIIEISATAPNPRHAAYLANVVAEEYRDQNLSFNRAEISELRKFLEEQLESKKKELENSEEELRSYKEKHQVSSLNEETQQLVNQSAQFEARRDEVLIELQAGLKRKESLTTELEKSKISLPSSVNQASVNPTLKSIQEKIAQEESDISVFEVTKPPQWERAVKEKKYLIDQYQAELTRRAKEFILKEITPEDPLAFSQSLALDILKNNIEIQSLQSRKQSLDQVVKDYEERLRTVPKAALELARLARNSQVHESTYLLLVQKLQEAKISEAGQRETARILDPALPPPSPIKPKKKLNLLLGILVGFGLGVGISLLKEYLDDTIKTIEDVENFDLNVLGVIPVIPSDVLEKKVSGLDGALEARLIESRLVTHFEPKSPISESYRSIRTNIQFSRVDHQLKTMMITSSGPREGKSTTVANLAITMAQMGIRTLLVDADMRRPVIHSIFGIKKDEGLTTCLLGGLSLKQAVKGGGNPNLSLLTSGVLPPNPSELLGSVPMKKLIEEMKNNYDFVIFDSPPVIAVTDASVLGGSMDGVIVIISSGETTREALNRAMTQLRNLGVRVIGSVLNNFNLSSAFGTSYYYYNYNYYYGMEGKKKKIKLPFRKSQEGAKQ